MHISAIDGKNICLLGFGREGQAALRMIEKYAPNATVTIADKNTIELPAARYTLIAGPDYLEQTDAQNFDIILKSPGIPPHPLLAKWKSEGRLSTGTQIFLDSIKDTGAKVIGVTGSKGKSTTSTLLFELFKANGTDVHLIGNIGKPAIEYIDAAKPGTIFVEEFSSYQLMDLTVSPPIAVVTSFFPEHLDYHGSLEAYWTAKSHIARFQDENGVVFYNGEQEGTQRIAAESAGKKIQFTPADAPITIEETHLLGRHNLSNIAAAYAVARHLGIAHDTCMEVFRSFHGLPHRLQALGLHHGIHWIDDAISTTPESTIAALDALGDRVTTIILGGQDRGNDFSGLATRLTHSKVRTAILFPGSGPRIREALRQAGAEITLHDAPDMPTAVRIAKAETPAGSVCLLSTASPSYGMFKNFEEKGEMFRECIEK